MNFKQLSTLLNDNIIDWCMGNRLIDNHKSCRHCRRPMLLESDRSIVDGCVWRCQTCRIKTSIRKDSLFYGSHLSIRCVIELLYWWTIKLPVTQAAHECQISEATAIFYFKIFRNMCLELTVGGEKIGGPGVIVEIDEMKLGKRKFHRGRRIEGQWCFGGIERREDKDAPIRCFIIPVENRTRETLLPIIQEYIEDGTTIYSDCWRAYDVLNDEGFIHQSVNHSLYFRDPNTGVHTNTVEGMWNLVRRDLPKFGTKKEHYHAHLAEFVLRKRHRNFNLFDWFIENLSDLVRWD